MTASMPCLVPGVQKCKVRCGDTRGTLHRALRVVGVTVQAGILVGIVDRDDRAAKNMQLQAAGCDLVPYHGQSVNGRDSW